MCERRSPLEVGMEVLRFIGDEGPIRVTHLMQRTNSTTARIHSYLIDFLRWGWVVEERLETRGRYSNRQVGKGYSLTEKGLRVLDAWECFQKAWEEAST